jgi:DNA polymerase-3 subunit epsilon
MGRRSFIKKVLFGSLFTTLNGYASTNHAMKTAEESLQSRNARLVFIDTKSSGITLEHQHRIIEIAAIEYINLKPTGNIFHAYVNPEREMDSTAEMVYGLSFSSFLEEQPRFSDIADSLYQFIKGAVVVAHNAPFDVLFLNHEFSLVGKPSLTEISEEIIDTLKLAKNIRPGKRNNLESLCLYYGIDPSACILPRALRDATLLSQVYIAMTS